ncbi:Rtr1/RPAP2 family-domain-containing protein [Tricladium varicosporioides]|nr:Rtr1/RPAP2 family-domain-containing protein [Hymenoscyphus varicosporioides]
MATAKMPKSILKKSSYPATTTNSKEERDRELALYHARLIQARKDIELEILLSTETLIDYPLATSPHDASNPSPEDAKAFKDFLRPFQPSDYDALIVERNINEHCGYTLCPKPRVKETGGGRYRIVGTRGRAKDFKVVEKEELEKWCSEACARRALYVRVQLSETVAWERSAAQSLNIIDLLDEPKSEESITNRLQQLELGNTEDPEEKHKADNLALERGDQGRAVLRGLVDVKIEEKDIRRAAEPPSLDQDSLSGQLESMHMKLEGHVPKFGGGKETNDDDDDDGGGMDWKM